jgi:hypothetical protein
MSLHPPAKKIILRSTFHHHRQKDTNTKMRIKKFFDGNLFFTSIWMIKISYNEKCGEYDEKRVFHRGGYWCVYDRVEITRVYTKIEKSPIVSIRESLEWRRVIPHYHFSARVGSISSLPIDTISEWYLASRW